MKLLEGQILIKSSDLLEYCNYFYKIATKNNKCLKVFDFDHTLVTTNCKKWLKNTHSGKEYRVDRKFMKLLKSNSHGFTFNERGSIADIPKHWSWDWREFLSDLVEPVKIHQDIIKKLRKCSKDSNCKTIILSARPSAEPIKTFLKTQNISNVDVYALDSNESNVKSDFIEKMMLDKGFRDVEFWDDSLRHINAMRRLNKKWREDLAEEHGEAEIKIHKP